MAENTKKKGTFFRNIFSFMFRGSNHEELSPLEEEAMRTPFQTIVTNFLHNKVALVGTITFLLVIILCFGLSYIFPLDINFYDSSQANISPGYGIMSYPKELKGNVGEISVGSTFGVAVGKDGTRYQWNDLSDPTLNRKLETIPPEAENLKMISAGLDHVLAVNEDNVVLTWGNDFVKKLSNIPKELTTGEVPIRQVVAAAQYSLALTEEGYLYFWGNGNLVEMDQNSIKKDYQGNIKRVSGGSNNVILIMEDGSINVLGMKGTIFFQYPEDLPPVVDVAMSETAALGLTEDGRIVTWGGGQYDLLNIPEEVVQGEVKQIAAGRYHFTALMNDGTVVSWGRELFGESNAPNITDATAIYSGYFQNYAVREDGSIATWGKSGYLMGSDALGRDVFRRLLTGGRITLFIGAVAVLIAMVIGVTVGGVAGFYGGRIDNILMRISEVMGSVPFLPLAMTLSAMIGNNLSDTGRIFMIMAIQGVLSWPPLARLVRGQILAEREKEFVTAAKALGIRERVIIFRHILPNVISVIIVNVTLRYATSLLTESSLSFLGFGVVAPNPTWGNMLSNSQSSKILKDYWWRWVFPAAALSVSTISINCIGDGLRDAIDPKTNER